MLGRKSVAIVGAGASGTLAGYSLSLAGVDVTYLVRPGSAARLSRPQLLYSYDDQSIKTFSGFKIVTTTEEMISINFDYVLVTLDGSSLNTDEGKRVVRAIGKAYRGTSTGVLVGTVGVDSLSVFIKESGLLETQVAVGLPGALIYEPHKAKLPVHEGVNESELQKADFAFKHFGNTGINLDDSAPLVAGGFAELFDRNGFTKAQISSRNQLQAGMPTIVLAMAWHLLDYPSMSKVDPNSEIWTLGTNAMREFQSLSVYGDEANAAAEKLTPEVTHQMFKGTEEYSLPLDFPAFMGYHHGRKVYAQDLEMLEEALVLGAKENLKMPALQELVSRLSKKPSSNSRLK